MMRTKAIVLAAFGVALMAASTSAQTQDPKMVAAGKVVFNDKKWDCVKCHSAEGVGNKKMPMERITLTADEMKKWITSPVEMTAKLPKKPAVPMKKQALSPVEVDSVIAYLISIRK